MTSPEYDIPESKVIETEFGPVEYAIVGEGKPVLAFHGGGGGYDMAVLIYSMFSDAGFSLICPSRPGYLRTPLTSGKSIPAQVDLCAALLDELGLDEVGVVGASAGGPLAYEFAKRHPDKTKAIVVIDGISMKYEYQPIDKVSEKIFLSDKGQKFQFWLAGLMPKTVIKQIVALEGDLTHEELKERVKNIYDDPVKHDFINKFFRTLYPYSERKEGTWNDVETEAEIDKIEDLDTITCPALIMHANRDNDVVMAHAEYAVSEIPGAEFYLIKEGTHFGFWVSDYAEEAQKKAVDFFKDNL
ncbi:alpha/beta fold hydrolase [Methanoplanus limicola]|uniref:Alpha/beta hydrolase fold containing protein n=1 Tax=Methanoplanus limicola DSM 2279 TaxID=937775 RepID=H1YZF6_9EURY|nr:alpha/beta hydrolase [Methanoplanus limicola]EHQ36065.1 alpha/beta hydrolase fold containing protein [Methanoplanus limicola DSM 2279]